MWTIGEQGPSESNSFQAIEKEDESLCKSRLHCFCQKNLIQWISTVVHFKVYIIPRISKTNFILFINWTSHNQTREIHYWKRYIPSKWLRFASFWVLQTAKNQLIKRVNPRPWQIWVFFYFGVWKDYFHLKGGIKVNISPCAVQ